MRRACLLSGHRLTLNLRGLERRMNKEGTFYLQPGHGLHVYSPEHKLALNEVCVGTSPTKMQDGYANTALNRSLRR